MAIFAVTFRIHEDANYDDRYQSLVKQIESESVSSTWDEPTSFVLVESKKNSQELCDALYYGSSILESKDMLLVVNLSKKGYAQKGSKYPNTLDAFMQKR
jgi:hypothetical protein